MEAIKNFFLKGPVVHVIFRCVLTFACIASFVIAFSTPLRNSFRSKFIKQKKVREILATASGDLLSNGSSIKVIKIKTNKGLILEVYGQNKNFAQPLIDSLFLPHMTDGYFHFRGQATNLALDDVDGDNRLELIAPSFDKNLVAHLNVYKYNLKTQKFEPLRR